MNCPFCNTEIADNAKFCPRCGKKIADYKPPAKPRCPKCGAEIGTSWAGPTSPTPSAGRNHELKSRDFSLCKNNITARN